MKTILLLEICPQNKKGHPRPFLLVLSFFVLLLNIVNINLDRVFKLECAAASFAR